MRSVTPIHSKVDDETDLFSEAGFSFLRTVVQKFDTLDVLVSRITIAKGTSLSRLNVIKLFGVEILKI